MFSIFFLIIFQNENQILKTLNKLPVWLKLVFKNIKHYFNVICYLSLAFFVFFIFFITRKKNQKNVIPVFLILFFKR